MIRADMHPEVSLLDSVFFGLAKDHRSVRLEFDRDYGMDKRTGWSVSIDGIVRCEFAESPLRALLLAIADEMHMREEV